MTAHSAFRFGWCATAVLLAVGAAHAGEASRVAERGGFLVGHAYRCGVAAERLDPTAQLIGQLAASLSIDGDDREAADGEFFGEVLVTALAEEIGGPLPSCNAIRREFALLEQHQRLVFIPGGRAMPNELQKTKPQRLRVSSKAPGRATMKSTHAAAPALGVDPRPVRQTRGNPVRGNSSRLRELAAWYRGFAERAGNPAIWEARLHTAEDLAAEADRIDRTERI